MKRKRTTKQDIRDWFHLEAYSSAPLKTHLALELRKSMKIRQSVRNQSKLYLMSIVLDLQLKLKIKKVMA